LSLLTVATGCRSKLHRFVMTPSLARGKKHPGTILTLLGKNILGEVSYLCGYRSHSVSDRFPHFIFAGADLTRSLQVELGPVLMPDRKVTANFISSAALGSSDPSLYLILDAKKFYLPFSRV
jgi:hypothetical protein